MKITKFWPIIFPKTSRADGLRFSVKDKSRNYDNYAITTQLRNYNITQLQ